MTKNPSSNSLQNAESCKAVTRQRVGRMAVIKEGRVSGLIPNKEGFAVHYPGYPSSISRATQTLGGIQSILKARSSPSNKLELYFRPEDPYSHPVSGELRSCNSLLLKLSRKKKSCSIEGESQVQTQDIHANIVARIPEAYHFEGMADYQYVVPVHANIARRKRKNCSDMEGPDIQRKHGSVDYGPDDVMILLPPLFSLKDVPENIALRPPSTLSSRRKHEGPPDSHIGMSLEPGLAIDFKKVEEIPKKINWKDYIAEGSSMWEGQMVVSELFQMRPIWPKYSLTEHLLDKNFKYNDSTLKRLLLTVAYYFSGGPFQKFWIRRGYDPRKDPDSHIYQRIDFRVPPELRSYYDANAAKGLKNRWEDLCKFRAFPYKHQISLQLCELDDDYIQQEIQKPPKQKSCTYATGWFSQHVHRSLILCMKMRFLSVYPESGAEKLLKAISESFAKSKKACLYEDTPKPVEEKHQQINEEAVDDEANENPSNIDDMEVDEIESDDDEEEEELDIYGLDPDGEAENIPLQSHSHMDNTSTSYLQQLLGSFPSMDTGGDKVPDSDTSDEEYQIYEQDNDEHYFDDDNDE